MVSAPASVARRIIAKFGGPLSLSRALTINGERIPASTVASWQTHGIPVKWQHPVVEAGKRAAVPIVPEDFFLLHIDPPIGDRIDANS